MSLAHYDVAIIGGGPAGLQAALVLARTRKKIIVFDSPEPPRNSASHGVHNFLGLDGLLPAEIRELAWRQIQVYNSAELCIEKIVDVQQHPDHGFTLSGSAGTTITAAHVMLAVGYQDIYPEIPGFAACWGNTIIPCPFCDGYENRDRLWGIVAYTERALSHLPLMSQNWTARTKIIISPHIAIPAALRDRLIARKMPIHVGEIVEVHHTQGSVEAVTLSTGERVEVETLLWTLPEMPTALTRRLIENLQLELDENGAIKTDAIHQTSIAGLWAVGDIKGNIGALGAAAAAQKAAFAIVGQWFE